jgi:hypothetical protein
MLTIVPNPMGNVPRNRDCPGWNSIFLKTDGQMAYRSLKRWPGQDRNMAAET